MSDPKREAARLRKGIRIIAGFPDHEAWWDIARLMIARLLAGESPEAAKRASIQEYDESHGLSRSEGMGG